MTDHLFHCVIGELINDIIIKQKELLKNESLRLWQDKACEPAAGQIIALYRKVGEKEIEFCNVDMLIEVDGKAKVIIEIEKSDITPVHIIGKFFASAFSDGFKVEGSTLKKFSPRMLFIHILAWGVDKPTSLKPRQWEHIAALMGGISTCRYQGREWDYRIIFGSEKKDFGAKTADGKHLISIIRESIGIIQ